MMTQENAKADPFAAETLVYIRHLQAAEVNELLPPNLLQEINDADELYAVLSGEGVQLAIVEGREAAFAAALAHDLQPMSVH